MICPKMLFFCADFPREQGTNCTGGARRRSVSRSVWSAWSLLPLSTRATSDSGSKLHALHTLRAIWFRLSRAEDRRALPAVTDRLPSSIKLQNEPGCAARFWILVFGISLDPGCWSLDLPWTLDLGAGGFCAYSVFMTVLDAIQRSTDFLARKGVDSSRLQTELLLAQLLNLPRMKLY